MNDGAGYNLAAFLIAAEMDIRITSTHICLFMVLYSAWLEAACLSSFQITRRRIMKRAKLSIATYHKCMSELNHYGYLTYLPSYHPAFGSSVALHFLPADSGGKLSQMTQYS